MNVVRSGMHIGAAKTDCNKEQPTAQLHISRHRLHRHHQRSYEHDPDGHHQQHHHQPVIMLTLAVISVATIALNVVTIIRVRVNAIDIVLVIAANITPAMASTRRQQEHHPHCSLHRVISYCTDP